jgi:hypothetical protein
MFRGGRVTPLLIPRSFDCAQTHREAHVSCRHDMQQRMTGGLVPKPNYRLQKQQRERKKTQQKEEKLRKKQERGDVPKTAETLHEEPK